MTTTDTTETSQDSQDKVPEPNAEYKHALRFYQGLHKAALDEEVNGRTIRMFQGMVTKVFDESSIPRGYYTAIMRKLEDNGNITKLQQGSRGTNSLIVLHEPPSWDSWRGPDSGLQKPLTWREDYAKLRLRVEVLENLIGGFNLVEALVNIEQRLSALESKPRKSTGKGV